MLLRKWHHAAVGPVLLGLFTALCHSGLAGAEEIADSEGPIGVLSYRADAEGVRPVARSVDLSTTRPQEFLEDVAYHGTLQRYAQLRYGSENSRRVVVVVDELGEGEYEFYVDANRDRRIAPRDLVGGTGRSRTCKLKTEIIYGEEFQHEERQIELRLGITRTRLSVATLGCIEGRIPWRESVDSYSKELGVRRIDGNANGLFADARDRLLIDIDDDGIWDPITEQFAYLPVQNIDGRRYAVRSDRMGNQFSLSEITGTGQLRIVTKLAEPARIVAFEAMIFSDDGSAYSLKQPDAPLSVPVGRYALGSVTMTIDNGERDRWHFVFSRGGSVAKDDWIPVAAGEDVALEAFGEAKFVLNLSGPANSSPGEAITVNPRLYTQDGLLINLSCRGEHMGSYGSERFHNRCDIKLTTEGGDTLSAAQSGFA